MLMPPSSNTFEFWGINVHYYGIIMAIAIIASIFEIKLICQKWKKCIDFDVFYDILPFIILVSICFARIYYVCLNFSYYKNHLKEIFMIWNGGLSIHGAILGGIVALIIITNQKKLNFFEYADILTTVLPLGQAIGRWGNFFNQEAFGSPCNYFWCMYIEPQFRPVEYSSNSYFHPTFLYESLMNLILFLILLKITSKYNNLKSGTIFCTYLILYSICRFFIELIRIDANQNVYSVPLPAIISILIIFIAFMLFLFLYKRN